MSTEQAISPSFHHEEALKTLARSNGLLETAQSLNITEIQGLAAALISLAVRHGGTYFRNGTASGTEKLKPYARPDIINALTAVNHGSTTLEDIQNAEIYKIWQALDTHDSENAALLPVVEDQLHQNRQSQLDEDDASIPLTEKDIASVEVPTTYGWVSNPTLNVHENGHRTLSLEVTSPFKHEGKNTVEFHAYIQYHDSKSVAVQGGSTRALSSFDADVVNMEMTVYQMVRDNFRNMVTDGVVDKIRQTYELVVNATNQQTGEKQQIIIAAEDITVLATEE